MAFGPLYFKESRAVFHEFTELVGLELNNLGFAITFYKEKGLALVGEFIWYIFSDRVQGR